jgi:hypothetical protein
MPGRLVNPIAALVAEIAVIDSDLGDELRRTTRRVVALVRLLEPALRHFAQLELRLERTIAQVEEATGQEVSDELAQPSGWSAWHPPCPTCTGAPRPGTP